jgi:hypothetical protein
VVLIRTALLTLYGPPRSNHHPPHRTISPRSNHCPSHKTISSQSSLPKPSLLIATITTLTKPSLLTDTVAPLTSQSHSSSQKPFPSHKTICPRSNHHLPPKTISSHCNHPSHKTISSHCCPSHLTKPFLLTETISLSQNHLFSQQPSSPFTKTLFSRNTLPLSQIYPLAAIITPAQNNLSSHLTTEPKTTIPSHTHLP